MVNFPRILLLRFFFFFSVVVVIYAGHHAQCKSQAGTAGVYDVTHYGATTTSSDNKAAFLATWRDACGVSASAGGGNNATLLVPDTNGGFAVGAVEFAGPCGNGDDAPAVVIDGVIRPGGRGLAGGQVDAWITFSRLNNLLVTGAGTLDGRGEQQSGKGKSKPTSLVFEDVTNLTVSGLRLVNSRGFHVTFRNCNHVEASGLHIHAAAGSRNTDGVHVGRSSAVRVLDSVIGTGDDCVSVGPGSTDVVVRGVVCGPGHGISVGSLGKKKAAGEAADVRGLVVTNCTLRGTTNGVRIKTWPGSSPGRASNITFQDITMVNVSNPIIIDQQYCPHGHCSDADKPSLVQISDVTFKQIEGTSSSRVAVQLLCSEDRPCTGVRLVDVSLSCGDRPCRTEFVNVQGTPLSPGPAAAYYYLEEEANDVLASRTEQLARTMN